MREDGIIQKGGQVQGKELDPPKLLQSSLQDTASIYQKQFNREDRNDLLNRLKCDPTLLTEPHVMFRTDLFTSFNADNIDAMYSTVNNTLLQKTSNYL